MGKVQVAGLARQLNINRALKSAIAQPWLLATLYHFVRSDAKKRTVAGWPRPNELADMTKALKHQRVCAVHTTWQADESRNPAAELIHQQVCRG